MQKLISLSLVLLLGTTLPTFAADFANSNLLPHRLPLAANRVILGPGVAFAPPQSGQSQSPQTPAAQSRPAKSGGSGSGHKILGLVLLGAGGGLIARGAILSDPCKGLNGNGYSCTSNYTTVRAVSFGSGAGLSITGLILLLRH
jgi:hypothetical protein